VDPSGRVVFGGRGYLGSVSNNVAEFTAFAAACQWVAESNVLPSATILDDSELVTDAFHGRKTLRLPALRHLMVVAEAWLAQAGAVCVEHVPRHENERADALANAAVDQQCSNTLLRDPLDWVVPPSCPPGWAYFESDDPALPPRMAGTRSVTKALAEVEVPSAADLMLPRSENFVAGNLHRFAHLWARICSKSVVGAQGIRWATDGVDVHDFFVPFVGKFNGRNYRSLVPPRTQFRNHLLSPAHKSFVSSEIQRELRIGAVRRWGTVGEVKPPHLVLPVGVEPSKPRKLNEAA
jgi:ribonuclease HI